MNTWYKIIFTAKLAMHQITKNLSATVLYFIVVKLVGLPSWVRQVLIFSEKNFMSFYSFIFP